jgi:hypothetical protein
MSRGERVDCQQTGQRETAEKVANACFQSSVERSAASTFDLAADIADNPAQPTAQDTQLPLMPPELFGMSVAARHHRGGLGHARIGLPQSDAMHGRQAIGESRGPMSQFGRTDDFDVPAKIANCLLSTERTF